MNAAELMQRVIEYGVDESGINDRFMGNSELYLMCFQDFIEEPNLRQLAIAIKAKDYDQAFSSAHALKGLSGNLGLTGYYEAICVLVESLRAESYGEIDEQYARVQLQYERLCRVVSDGQSQASPEEDAAPENSKAEPSEQNPERARFIRIAAAAIVLMVVGIGSLFLMIYNDYSNNIIKESADHLIEINYQLKLYIEDRIINNWNTAYSVGDSILYSNYNNDDEKIFGLLIRKKDVWGVTDLMLYTENGYGINTHGKVEPNDIASEMIDRAREFGEYMAIVDSQIIYTVPIDTRIKYHGSKIAAISVVQNMESFLDDMDFSSFDDNAWMYLTDKDGIVISKLTNKSAIPAFNFTAVVGDRELTGLNDGGGKADMLSVEEPTAFMMASSDGNDYVIATPINTNKDPLRLFYLAPSAVVNEKMNSFSTQLVSLSLFVTIFFLAITLLMFWFIYQNRKKQFNKELLNRDRMLELVVQNTQTAFGLFSVNQREPIYVSDNSERIVGEEYLNLISTEQGLRMRNSTGTDTEIVRAVNERIRGWDGKSRFRSGYILNKKSVPPSYFELQLYPVEGEEMDFVGIAQDVTQIYEREKATRSALEMAERANRAKSRFLSNMSHDIRTPMNAIINMAGFAMESINQPQKLKAYLKTICESSDHLLRLINDVLDMSRIESGQLTLSAEPFDLRNEILRQADIIAPLCAAKRQSFITDFSRISTATVYADRLKFSQIIMNLLSNAVKFTPDRGAVRFTAEEIPSLRDDIADIRFTVEDNGIGISKEYLEHIFEPFSRADSKRVSNIEGTGLGLSICKSYINAMGGTIKCESKEGDGSTFTVELFFQKTDAVPEGIDQEQLVETPFLGKRCLVGEDNSMNQIIAKTILERLGFIVDVVSNGKECVNRFMKAKAGYYDVIYLDIQMPGMDGYQTTVAIRESSHKQAKTIPIVAITANVFAEDVEKARIAGMDGYLGKPIMTINLIEETNKAMNRRKGK